jgi:hypothetical protein
MAFSLYKALAVYTVVLFMDHLLPEDGKPETRLTRLSLASAIVESSDDPDDWALLAGIARWESFYRPDVLVCKTRSSCGASGPFQVIPRSREEGILLCTNWVESAKRALQRVQESRSICRHLPKPDQLAQYTTGNCGDVGKRMSRMRHATSKDMYFWQ